MKLFITSNGNEGKIYGRVLTNTNFSWIDLFGDLASSSLDAGGNHFGVLPPSVYSRLINYLDVDLLFGDAYN